MSDDVIRITIRGLGAAIAKALQKQKSLAEVRDDRASFSRKLVEHGKRGGVERGRIAQALYVWGYEKISDVRPEDFEPILRELGLMDSANGKDASTSTDMA